MSKKLKAKYVVANNNPYGGVNIHGWYSNKKDAEKYAKQVKARVFELVEVEK